MMTTVYRLKIFTDIGKIGSEWANRRHQSWNKHAHVTPVRTATSSTQRSSQRSLLYSEDSLGTDKNQNRFPSSATSLVGTDWGRLGRGERAGRGRAAVSCCARASRMMGSIPSNKRRRGRRDGGSLSPAGSGFLCRFPPASGSLPPAPVPFLPSGLTLRPSAALIAVRRP